MTKYNSKQIEEMHDDLVGKMVIDLTYEPDEDYYTIEFSNIDGSGHCETSFRYMTDLVN